MAYLRRIASSEVLRFVFSKFIYLNVLQFSGIFILQRKMASCFSSRGLPHSAAPDGLRNLVQRTLLQDFGTHRKGDGLPAYLGGLIFREHS